MVMLIGWSSSYAQDSQCLEEIRTGKFKAISEDGKELAYTVIRKKKKQIEVYNNGQSKIVSRIDWLNDSTYTLTTIEKINAPGCDKVGAIARVRILNCKNLIQTCEWSQDGCGKGVTRLKKISAK